MKANPTSPRTTSTLRSQIFKMATILGLALGAFFPTTARAVAPNSGVPFVQALSDAQSVANMNSNWQVFMIKGQSMEPQFGKNSMLVINKCGFDALRPGMIVIYRDDSGDMVAHRLVEKTADGWIAKGQNNDKADPGRVTASNLQGAVFAIIHYKAGSDQLASVNPSIKPELALAKTY